MSYNTRKDHVHSAEQLKNEWLLTLLPCQQSHTVRTVAGFPTKIRTSGKSDGYIWSKIVRITGFRITRWSGLPGYGLHRDPDYRYTDYTGIRITRIQITRGSGLPSGYFSTGSVSTIGKCGVGRYMRQLSVASSALLSQNVGKFCLLGCDYTCDVNPADTH